MKKIAFLFIILINLKSFAENKKNLYLTNWINYTPEIEGCGTVSEVKFWYKRLNRIVSIKGSFKSGTPFAKTFSVSIPKNLKMNQNSSNGYLKAIDNKKIGLLSENGIHFLKAFDFIDPYQEYMFSFEFMIK